MIIYAIHNITDHVVILTPSATIAAITEDALGDKVTVLEWDTEKGQTVRISWVREGEDGA